MHQQSLLSNLHTHTFRCQHASGDVADYCANAVERGLSCLGMSDHTPLPDGRWANVRMRMDELDAYCDAISAAQQQFPELRVLRGMECEYWPEYTGFYRDELLGERQFDYLIGAAHYIKHKNEYIRTYRPENAWDAAKLRSYTDYFIASMQSGLFLFMAHPDVFAASYLDWDAEAEACSRAMLSAAAELKMPLEINGYGFRKPPVHSKTGPRNRYPWLPFWKLAAEYEIKAVVNSDAHRPHDVTANMQDALAFAAQYGVEVVDLSAEIAKS